MIYDIKMRVTHDYGTPAVGGRHVLCMMPINIAGVQQVLTGQVRITPTPDERIDRVDFFGNHVTEFSCRAPHDRMVVALTARVDCLSGADLAAGQTRVDALPGHLDQCRNLGAASPLHFLSPSFRVPLDKGMAAFARAEVSPSMIASDAVIAVGRALHRYMRFDTRATEVDTTAAEAFRKRKGVCQDYSHIMIAALRGIGIPAGYVSGFLRTLPPPGKPRLEGADAMHAWVRAWCGPDLGWIAFDPTNDRLAGEDHVVVAYGRDYADVAPVRGRLRIAGRQKTLQAVDVVPVTA